MNEPTATMLIMASMRLQAHGLQILGLLFI